MAKNTIVFTDNLPDVLSAIESSIEEGLVRVGAAAQEYAKDNTPVRTGTLRDSIGVLVDKDKQEVYIGTLISKFPKQPYGKAVELGSRGRKGVHMLQRAATEHKEEYKRIIEESMKNA